MEKEKLQQGKKLEKQISIAKDWLRRAHMEKEAPVALVYTSKGKRFAFDPTSTGLLPEHKADLLKCAAKAQKDVIKTVEKWIKDLEKELAEL